jgi:serine/threonine protein kinase
MPSPATVEEFLDLVHKSGVADDKRLDSYVLRLRASGHMPAEPPKLAGLLVRDGLLTHFQAEHIAQGKWKRFTIGKYKVLERLGSGGMGSVFLCEHKLMRCLRAIKILPAAKAQDEAALGRFYREARAVAAIDHPNIVHAYDIDQDESLHFLVMEYVDGASLQDMVKKAGPMEVLRACHYIRQAAIGLDHAHRAGLVHRDIKPGNILVSREGTVKILDMGLARFFNDEDDILTRKFDETVLGTADYLAPEQAIDSHTVDIRADIYSLGATFYYMLSGKTPFGDGTVAQKLMWHQTRRPKPIRELRREIPVDLEAIISKMMDKDPSQRYAVPAEVAEALEPFVQTPIEAPPEAEMPRLSPAASGRIVGETNESGESTAIRGPATPPRALKGMGSGSNVNVNQGAPAPVTPPPSRPTSPTPPPVRTPPGRATGSGPAVSAPVKPAPPPPVRPRAAATATTAQVLTSAPPSPQASALASAPAPTAAPQTDEQEEFAWQQLAGDTHAVADHADTAPNDQPQTAARPIARGERKAVAREKGIVLMVIALMVLAGVLVVVVGVGLWLYSIFTSLGVNGQARPRLLVSAQEAGKPGVYKSVQAALRVAQKDDIIEIADESIEENIFQEFNPRHSMEVTIQAAPGKSIIWRSARKDPNQPIIRLSGASFFKLKGEGITFDGNLAGKEKVKDLVFVLSSSEGLTLEGAQFKNFGRSAVCIMNAAGNVEFPMRFNGLTALTPPADKDGSMFYIDAQPNMRIKQVDYIEITDVRAPGLAREQIWREENGALGRKYHKLQLPGAN